MLKTKSVCLVVIAVGGVAFAQNRNVKDYPGTVARASYAGPDVLTAREALKATYSDSGGGDVTASCGSASCLATPVTIYSYSLACPGLAGKTCTYDIQIAGQVASGGNSIGYGEDGLYQFFVDGAVPTGGGTDSNGFYAWQILGPEFTFGTSYNVHSHVTNTSANQAHTVTVKLSCADIIGDSFGCSAHAGSQTLVVRVWQP